jgi:hypothetical protein
VARILTAEDARDSTSPAFSDAARADEHIRSIARRALSRIRDPHFAERDSYPAPSAPPPYADAAWRERYRELGTRSVDCAIVERAIRDREHAVVLRAIDVLTPECATEADRRQLRDWTEHAPTNARRRAGAVAWQAQAQALIAVARILPNEARPRVTRFAASSVPAVRAYAARAARLMADTATLRALTHDPDDNVKEAAIDAPPSPSGSVLHRIVIRCRGHSLLTPSLSPWGRTCCCESRSPIRAAAATSTFACAVTPHR